MIRFPSISSLWQLFKNAFYRFPLQAIIALVAMSLLLWVINENLKSPEPVIKAIFLCNLAFTFSLSAALYAETRGWRKLRSIGVQLATIAFPAVLYLFLNPQYLQSDSLRLALFILAGHLLVSFSAYPRFNEVRDFWHFNKSLFLRIITGFIFSVVLFIGLSVALLSIDTLFNYSLPENVYLRLFAIVSVGFNSLFFLAGIPGVATQDTTGAPLMTYTYPKVLKIFTQYVLIPLLSIYFAILLVYELKIIINAQLPDGMVSILILGYAVAGILSYLLIYPISNDSGNEWMRQFSKLFFWLMIPLIVLLSVAIWVRVAEYGLTEMRYFIILMAIWLTAITLYFILHKAPSIQLIPISLLIVILLATYGPQSAATLSKQSQQARLNKVLHNTDSAAHAEQISIIKYLVDYHGLPSLQEFSDKNLNQLQETILADDSLNHRSYAIKQKLNDTAFSLLNIDPYIPFTNVFTHVENAEKLIAIQDYDYVYWIGHRDAEELNTPLGKLTVWSDDNILSIAINGNDSVQFDISTIETLLHEKIDSGKVEKSTTGGYNSFIVPTEWVSISKASIHYHFELRIQTISLQRTENETEKVPPNITAILLIKKN